PADRHCCRVLLVADDQRTLRALVLPLEAQGHAVTAVGSGEEALRRVGDLCPDVLIAELRMPGLDGIGLSIRLRQRCPRTPVILLAGDGDIAPARSHLGG